MIVVITLYAAGAAVLLVAGLAKLARPAPAADLLSRLGLARLGPIRLGLRTRLALVRLIALTECALAIAALTTGDPDPPAQAFLVEVTSRPWPFHGGADSALAAAVGALYAAFAVVIVRAQKLGAPSCGCLGPVGAPPSLRQAALNLIFAASALIASAAPPDSTGSTPLEVIRDVNPLVFIFPVGLTAGIALTVLSITPRPQGQPPRKT